MNYATGYCFSLKDIYEKFDIKKLKIKWSELPNGIEKRRTLCRNIFADCMYLILNDIIDNNNTFELPRAGSATVEIHMQKVDPKQFKYVRQHGKRFDDVDFLASGFTGNELVMDINYKSRCMKKPIYVTNELKNKITKYTNEGKQYC